jgi:hypothetical protein
MKCPRYTVGYSRYSRRLEGVRLVKARKRGARGSAGSNSRDTGLFKFDSPGALKFINDVVTKGGAASIKSSQGRAS